MLIDSMIKMRLILLGKRGKNYLLNMGASAKR